MPAFRLDARLQGRGASARAAAAQSWPGACSLRPTSAGLIRVLDTGGDRAPLLLAPDGPCVIEHYLPLIERLAADYRVVCFDLPGFGFSAPGVRYRHRVEEGAKAVLAVLDSLNIPQAALAMSCVNGFYAIAASALAPQRITSLLLSQTPGVAAMQDWVKRIVPAPIRIPGLGQALAYAQRRRVARGWYNVALAQREQRGGFQHTADVALQHGGCFCFASVVQGMYRTPVKHPLLAGQPVPATLIWGLADRSHRSTEPESLRIHLPGVEVIRQEHTGHFPDLEDPAAYATIVRTHVPA